MLALVLLLGLRGAHAGTPGDVLQYVSPVPDARLVSTQTGIIIRPGGTAGRGAVHPSFIVTGTASGRHEGSITRAGDGATLIFTPSVPFAEREAVTVRFSLSREEGGWEFSFTTRGPPPRGVPPSSLPGTIPDGLSGPAANPADSLPADFPQIQVLVNDAPAPGRLFMAPLLRGTPRYAYLTILDEQLLPAGYLRREGSISDFGLQPNGLLTFFDADARAYYAMNSSFAIVDSFRCGNGYATDGHDLRLMPNGHALLMAYDPQIMDMRGIDPAGDSAAVVTGAIVQELDAQKNVVFEWRSWDHFSITDATHTDFTQHRVDYAHLNAFDIDLDGSILLSSRHMDEITKISRTTGGVLWRLGGKNNQFTFLNDTARFSYQHDIRRLPNGNITLFDNGNFHDPPCSRAVEYRLDEQAMTAQLVWEYRHVPCLQASATGNVQRQPNGNTLISWGTENTVTEVRADGTVALELLLSPLFTTYRTLRYPWTATAAGSEPPRPSAPLLHAAFPNPFNSSTTVEVELDGGQEVSLVLYNLLGQRVGTVKEGWQDAGRAAYTVARGDLASGVYFLRLTTGARSATTRLLLLR